MANIYSGILSGTMDAFASVISNNLNIVMKFLSIITIVMSMSHYCIQRLRNERQRFRHAFCRKQLGIFDRYPVLHRAQLYCGYFPF